MKRKYIFILFFIGFFTKYSFAQNDEAELIFDGQNLKKFTNIEEALKNPLEVESFILNDPTNPTENFYQNDTMLYHLAKFTNLKSLYITEYPLEEIIPHIKYLKKLQYLCYESPNVLYVPKEIGELTTLTHLTLYNNELLALPPEIKNLKNLKYLACTKTELTTLPKEIGTLENLLCLDISQNDIKTLPEELGNLTQLKYFLCTDNKIKFLPKSFKNLKNLEKLDVSNNQLEEITEDITQCNKLTRLILKANKLKALPPHMDKLTQLDELDVANNELTTLPKEICNLPNLYVLWITDNQLVDIPKDVGNLINLTHLKFTQNKIKVLPDEISNLKKLVELDMSYNELTRLPKGIENLPNLKFLNFNNNKIKDPFEDLFTKDNFTIQELQAIHNQIENISPNIKYLKAIKIFWLNGNNIVKLPKEIGLLQTLENFTIANNKLVTVSPEIGLLKGVRLLDFSQNCLVDLPKEIKNLENLTNLYISHNNFTKVPDVVLSLKNLTFFQISHNKLTTITPDITKLSQLISVDAIDNDITELPNEVFLNKKIHWNFSYNKLKKLPDSFYKDVLENDVFPTKATFHYNLFEELPISGCKDSYKLKELIGSFAYNPIKTFKTAPDNAKMDWFDILENERIDINQNIETYKYPEKKIYKYAYHNPNGNILYQYLRKIHKKIQENSQLAFYLMYETQDNGEKNNATPYIIDLINIYNLIRADLYGASWYIKNKDFKTATKILGEIKKTLKNFELKTDNKKQTRKLDFDFLHEKQAEALWKQEEEYNKLSPKEKENYIHKQGFEEWKSIFLEVIFLKKRYDIQLKKNRKIAEKNLEKGKKMTQDEIILLTTKEKESATYQVIVSFFLNILPYLYNEVEYLEKIMMK